MILYSFPYNTDKKLGRAYNETMELLPNNDDWSCFVDADTRFTTPNFGHQIENILQFNTNKDCGLFTAMTNRIGTNYQLVPEMWNIDDERLHREKGKELQQKYYNSVKDITDISPISGVLMLIKKETWLKAGKFSEKLDILGVDNDIHYKIQKLGLRVKVMQGVYLYHWYRGGNPRDKSHLI